MMIFLVVVGHLGYCDWGLSLNKVIYAFHMPVFVFLSGYFSSQNTARGKQVKWLCETLKIYFIAQFFLFLLGVGMEYATSLHLHQPFEAKTLSWNILFYPGFLWYILSLVYWRCSIWTLFKKMNDAAMVGLSFLLALGAGFIPLDTVFAFQQTFCFFPYFAMGLVFRKHMLMEKLVKLPYIYALVALFLCFGVAKYFLPMYMPKTHFMEWSDAGYRALQTLCGLCLCLLVIRVSRVGFIDRFARFGGYTLWIYIGHVFLIIIGNRVFHYFGVSLNLFTAFALAAVYCSVLIFVIGIWHKLISVYSSTRSSI